MRPQKPHEEMILAGVLIAITIIPRGSAFVGSGIILTGLWLFHIGKRT